MKKVLFIALCFIVFEAKAQITLTPYYASVVAEKYEPTLNGSLFRPFDYDNIDISKATKNGYVFGLRFEKKLTDHWAFLADLNYTFLSYKWPALPRIFFEDPIVRPLPPPGPRSLLTQKIGTNFGVTSRFNKLGLGLQLAPKMGFAVFDTSPAEEIFDFGGVAFVSYDIWKLQAFAKAERAVRFDLSGLSPGIKDVAMFTQISVGLGYRFTPKIKQ
jgi:hypothetical protein